jgi:nanoRNase/pAp phosphatase (c-di-AMP/oligoRNAs hydrolase)
MIVVTSGSRYLDIDSYACCVAYAELLRLLGKDAKAISTAPLNKSITPDLRALPEAISSEYQPAPDDSYIIMDLSDARFFDKVVDTSRIVELFDHHPGFEAEWSEKLGPASHIEFIGSAATLVFEQWERAGKSREMSQGSAQLIAAAILDNTLNFSAYVTTERDKAAYQFLARHASLDEAWVARYFSDCQTSIQADLPQAVRNDTKFVRFANRSDELYVGQLVVWDAASLIADSSSVITDVMNDQQLPWFVSIVSISEGRNHLMSPYPDIQKWLAPLLNITFDGSMAKTDRLWLRKEIMKVAEQAAKKA